MKNFIQNTFQSQRVFYRYFRRKGFKRFLKENILQSEGSNLNKAQSMALGIFIGSSPFWGFHTVLALALAVALRLNKMLVFIFTQITIAPLIPFLIYISMLIGDPFVKGETDFASMEFTLSAIQSHLLQYVIGSLILALISATIVFGVSYLILEKLSPRSKASKSKE